MKSILFAAALAVMAAPSAWAAKCTDNPGASIQVVEKVFIKQYKKLSKKKKQQASRAIEKAKASYKSGNKKGACKSLRAAQAVLKIKG